MALLFARIQRQKLHEILLRSSLAKGSLFLRPFHVSEGGMPQVMHGASTTHRGYMFCVLWLAAFVTCRHKGETSLMLQ